MFGQNCERIFETPCIEVLRFACGNGMRDGRAAQNGDAARGDSAMHNSRSAMYVDIICTSPNEVEPLSEDLQ